MCGLPRRRERDGARALGGCEAPPGGGREGFRGGGGFEVVLEFAVSECRRRGEGQLKVERPVAGLTA